MKNIEKLEQAVKQQDSNYSQTPGFKPAMTINEIALAQASNKSYQLREEMLNEERRHLLAKRRIQRQQETMHAAALIISGQSGFLRCSQGWADLKSGFTCLQEITNRLLEPMVDVSLEKMNVPFGVELWAIDERGMMTLIDAVRDSSD